MPAPPRSLPRGEPATYRELSVRALLEADEEVEIVARVVLESDMFVKPDAVLIQFHAPHAAHETDLVEILERLFPVRFQLSKSVDDDAGYDSDNDDIAEQDLK